METYNERQLRLEKQKEDYPQYVDDYGNFLVIKNGKPLIPSKKIQDFISLLSKDEIKEIFANKKVYDVFNEEEIYS